MKKTILSFGLISTLFVGSIIFVSAQMSSYYPSQNYYNGYSQPTYTQPTYNNCYYTMSYPPTYYGNCSGPGFNYTRNYQNNYQNTYQQTSPYYTYEYSNNGSWYPGYYDNTNYNNYNTGYTNTGYGYNYGYNNNNYGTRNTCRYQSGYWVCN